MVLPSKNIQNREEKRKIIKVMEGRWQYLFMSVGYKQLNQLLTQTLLRKKTRLFMVLIKDRGTMNNPKSRKRKIKEHEE